MICIIQMAVYSNENEKRTSHDWKPRRVFIMSAMYKTIIALCKI
jgi:hypothetical protein